MLIADKEWQIKNGATEMLKMK